MTYDQIQLLFTGCVIGGILTVGGLSFAFVLLGIIRAYKLKPPESKLEYDDDNPGAL